MVFSFKPSAGYCRLFRVLILLAGNGTATGSEPLMQDWQQLEKRPLPDEEERLMSQ
jgi:hypothetical protein